MTTLWSANYIIGKYALRELPPLLVVRHSDDLGGHHDDRRVLAAPICRPDPGVGPADVKLLEFLGILGVGLNQFFFVLGISLTTVSHGALMIGLTPITVLLLASVMGMETLNALRMAGMFIALAGVAVLQLSSSKSDGATVVGDALVYCAAFTFAIYTVKGKQETDGSWAESWLTRSRMSGQRL